MLTFGVFRKGGTARRMTGVCVDSRDFASYTNGAIDQLLRRGKWWGTFRSVRACVYDNCVTWPRHVQTILSVRMGNGVQNVFNQWFNFLPMQHCGYFYRDWSLNGRHHYGHSVNENTSPVFNPIGCNQNVFLQFFIDSPTDIGKGITVIGIDSNGQFVRTQRDDGTIQDGVRLTFAKPFVQTPMMFRHVLRVNKDETHYPVRGFQLNPTTGLLLNLAYYEPSETSPEYVRTKVGMSQQRIYTGCCEAEIEALVKIKFVPVKYDDDVLLIDNEAAIANMIMAQRLKEAGDLANSRAYEADAFRELNFQMKDFFPDEQFVVDLQLFGRDDGLNRDNIRIGML